MIARELAAPVTVARGMVYWTGCTAAQTQAMVRARSQVAMSDSLRGTGMFGKRLVSATVGGGCIGLLFAAVAAILAPQGAEDLRSGGLSAGGMVAVYVVGGLAGGVIVGLLLPLAKRSALAAMLVGYVAISPFTWAVAIAITRNSTVSPLKIAPITSLAGAYAAWLIWRDERPRKRK
jgi:hypothetical protein